MHIYIITENGASLTIESTQRVLDLYLKEHPGTATHIETRSGIRFNDPVTLANAIKPHNDIIYVKPKGHGFAGFEITDQNIDALHQQLLQAPQTDTAWDIIGRFIQDYCI